MALPVLVLATEYNVSVRTTVGKSGAVLLVYKNRPGYSGVDYAVKDKAFTSEDAARAWAWRNGYLKEHKGGT